MDEQYKYTPLHPWQLRVIELLPGEEEDPIVCLVRLTPDREHGPRIAYDALSYTWGNPQDTRTIWLDWRPFQVTSNLFAFLKQWRSRQQSVHYWIDAISINQNDTPERNLQVRRMTSIYEGAQRVPLWLGPAADKSDPAMDLLRNLGECIFQTSKPGGGYDFVAIMEWLRTQEGVQVWESKVSFTGEILDALVQLLKRPWWKRAWIVQEATVKDNMRTFVLCGDRSSNWLRLGSALTTIATLADPWVSASLVGALSAFTTLLSFLMSRMIDGDNLQLFNLLVQFRQHKATDERDLVYALIGMVKEHDGAGPPKPDYAKQTKEVYQEAAQHIIETSPYGQTLDILGYADDFDIQFPEFHDLVTDESLVDWPQSLLETLQRGLESGFVVNSEEESPDMLDSFSQRLISLLQSTWASLNTSKNEAGVLSFTRKERDHVKFLLDFLERGMRFDDEIPLAEKQTFAECGAWFKTIVPDLLTVIIHHRDHSLFLFLDPVLLIDLITTLSDVIDLILAEPEINALHLLDLSEDSPDPLPPRSRDWPSWVPDWRLSSTQSVPLSKRFENRPQLGNGTIVPYQSLYSASGNDKTAISEHIGTAELVSFEDNDLLVYGFQIDTIEHLRSLMVLSFTSDSEVKAELLSWVSGIIGPQYGSGLHSESLSDALNRALMADVTSTSHPITRLTRLTDGIAEPEHLDECMGRRLTITKHGNLGLVPFSARRGDEIFLLAGGQVFYVLRPDRNAFRLIGESYIHGLMDGEALTRLEEGETQLRQVRIT